MFGKTKVNRQIRQNFDANKARYGL